MGVNLRKDAGRFTIGLLIGSVFDDYEQEIWDGVCKAAQDNDINLLCFDGGGLAGEGLPDRDVFLSLNSVYELIRIDQLDGIIAVSACLGNRVDSSRLLAFLKNFSPLPVISIGMELQGCTSILTENDRGIREIMKHLIEVHGYRRIRFIHGPHSNPEAIIRQKAYQDTLEEYGIEIPPQIRSHEDSSFGFEKLNLSSIMDPEHPPEAFVCANDYLAIQITELLRKAGFRVPEEIAVTGFDDSRASRSMMPPLTTVHQAPFEYGLKACNVLIDILKGAPAPDRIVIPAGMVVRRSCGCFSYSSMHQINFSRLSQLDGLLKPDNLTTYIRDEIDRHFMEIRKPVILDDWANRVSKALLESLKKKNSLPFLQALENLIHEGIESGQNIENWYTVLVNLMGHIEKPMLKSTEKSFIWNLSTEVLVLLSDISERNLTRLYIEDRERDFQLYHINEALLTTHNREELKQILVQEFKRQGFQNCFIALYQDTIKRDTASLFLAYPPNNNNTEVLEPVTFPRMDLVPPPFELFPFRKSYFMKSLYYQSSVLGYIITEIYGQKGEMLENLSIQVALAIRSTLLMESIQGYSRELENQVRERTSKLMQANEQLQKMDKLKNDFIANITHDFRSPLTIILNTAELAQKRAPAGPEQEDYKLIFHSSLKLRRSIDRLLDLAKMDAQGLRLNVQKVKLVPFLESIIEYYQSYMKHSGFHIQGIFPGKIPEEFYCDPEKLEEILNNLISNALKFIDPVTGRITITLEAEPDFVEIRVADNGIGIPPHQLEKIFDRFEQLESGRNTPFGGSGIGLAFCRQMIEYMGGAIYAESEGEGRGSTFIVRLKQVRVPDNLSDLGSATMKAPLKHNHQDPILYDLVKGRKQDDLRVIIEQPNEDGFFDLYRALILIIDDDPDIARIVMTYLKHHQYKNFIIAGDGLIGLKAVFEYNPDLVICDYNMPKMKGDELQDQLLSHTQTKNIPFLFLSAIHDRELSIERRGKGASAFLKKPIDEQELVLAVELNLRKHFEYLKTLQLATLDELTGLNNRRSLLKRLHEELVFRKTRELSLIYFDVDYFKTINDTLGHEAGDSVLQTITKILKTTLRDYDIAGRYGGDEFIMLLPDCGLSKAEIIAKKLLVAVSSHEFTYNQQTFHVTISMGISSLMDNRQSIEKNLNELNMLDSPDTEGQEVPHRKKRKDLRSETMRLLIKFADSALYEAKRSVCQSCGFATEKVKPEGLAHCPNCNSAEITRGRNRIAVYKG